MLLLNAVLTVKAHNANSHKERGWEKLTDAVVTHLNRNSHGIVFILWGSYAQKKGSQIDKVSCIQPSGTVTSIVQFVHEFLYITAHLLNYK